MKLRFVRVALLSISVLITSVAHAGPYSNLYIFGDSLSDTGNLAWQVAAVCPPCQQVPGSMDLTTVTRNFRMAQSGPSTWPPDWACHPWWPHHRGWGATTMHLPVH